MPETDLRALRDKYERMLRLRLLHARAKAEPEFDEPDPRLAMAELAREFPGALREIDTLPTDALHQRIAALIAAERDPSGVEPWMHAQVAFHRLARGILTVKRWLAGRPVTPRLEADFAGAVARLPNGGDAMAWASELAAVSAPPRGRLMDLVYKRLARELGADEVAARAMVMPRRRSLRRRS